MRLLSLSLSVKVVSFSSGEAVDRLRAVERISGKEDSFFQGLLFWWGPHYRFQLARVSHGRFTSRYILIMSKEKKDKKLQF